MYKSPIETYMSQMRMEQEKRLESTIYRAVYDVGINVDKDELIKALRYDRGQYDTGYHDGYNADKWVNCSDRLPDERETVLVWFEHFKYGNPACPIQTVGIGYIYRDRWIVDETAYCGLQVFAWQPLPDRPTKFAIIKKGDRDE